MDSEHHWLITAGLVTSSVIALTANCFLLIIFCKRRGLRTVPNRFIINLLITNLLSSLLLIPLLLTDQEITNQSSAVNSTNKNATERIFPPKTIPKTILDIKNNIVNKNTSLGIIQNGVVSSELFNRTTQKCLCYFAQSSTTFVCTASIFSILLIGINQYFGVIHSLRYHFYINKCKSTILIISSWLMAFLFSLLGSLTQTDNSLWHFCEKNSTQQHSSISIFNTAYAFSYFIVVILVPFMAICIIYVCIYRAAHKNSERMRKSTSSSCNLDTYVQLTVESKKAISQENHLNITQPVNGNLPKVHSAPNFLNLNVKECESGVESEETVPEKDVAAIKIARTNSDKVSTNILTSIKHKISNASVFRYREETRAAKISFLVIFMVLICYIPYGLTLILNAQLIDVKISDIFNYVSIVLLITSNIISPFLFGYRNKRVKREICKIFGLSKPRTNQGNLKKESKDLTVMFNDRCLEDVNKLDVNVPSETFLDKNYVIPEVIVTYKLENERKSILKRVCNSSSWTNYKKCNFITVPDSCISGEARGSFSSASTQISSEG